MKFKLWKDNKIDQEHEMTLEEIRKAYEKFCQGKVDEGKADWLMYYGHQTVNWFIIENEDANGLQSVVEQEDYVTLQGKLMDIRQKHYPKQKVG